MRLGNILASIGILIGVMGVICLPFWNLHELPYIADPSYPKGGGWILFVQAVIFARIGILFIALGIFFYGIAKLLPKRFWYTSKDLFEDEIRKGFKKNESKNK